ncbi:MAG: lactate utilization protein [Ruminococcaceae bacterium]|nr:lactate utilization protein [Oscillospiraceae bacterium]
MDFTKVKSALEERGYQVTVCDTKEAASDYLNAQIDGRSVSFGGSMTLKELGLFESLATHNTMLSHWHVPEGKTGADVLREAVATDVFLTSANGLAETGEIINIDGTGNRVAGTLYGHRKVYFVIGRNKLAPDYEKALWRARNIASPKNAQRLGVQTPCAAKGDKCYDCKSPQRICRGLVVLWEAVKSCETEVVLVDEDLGY